MYKRTYSTGVLLIWITLIWIRMRLFTLMRIRIRIRHFTCMRIRIFILMYLDPDKARHQSDANLHPLGLGTPTSQIVSLHGSRVSLHGSRVSLAPGWASITPLWASTVQLLVFHSDADPNPAFHFDADPRSQNVAVLQYSAVDYFMYMAFFTCSNFCIEDLRAKSPMYFPVRRLWHSRCC
jgi:hypothetical protein